MAGPLDRLSAYFGKPVNPPVPPAPPPTYPSPKAPLAPQRIPVRDLRDVDPGSRVGGQYQVEPLEDVARAALEHGVPPDLALAMTIRENSTALANPGLDSGPGTRNPLSLVSPPAWADDENQIEPAMLHAVERASAVAPQGRERQIQAYQGLGKQPAGYNERFKGQDNPYAKAVEEIRERVVNVSPALQSLLQNLRPSLSLTPISAEHATAIGESITRRIRNPGLWK